MNNILFTVMGGYLSAHPVQCHLHLTGDRTALNASVYGRWMFAEDDANRRSSHPSHPYEAGSFEACVDGLHYFCVTADGFRQVLLGRQCGAG